MKRILFLAICCLAVSMANGQGSWSQKSDFGGAARYRTTGVEINGKGYFIMGACNNVPSTNDFWEYDPQTNTWTQKANFPGTARGGSNMAAFEINGKGYFGLGAHWTGAPGAYTCYSDFWEYNPLTNSWTQKLSFPGTARQSLVSFSINEIGYIVSGVDNSFAYLNDLWAYDPGTNSWTQKANMGSSLRGYAIGFVVGQKAYVGLGESASGAYTNDFWEYDPATNAWTQKSDYPGSGRVMASAFAIGDCGYVGCGYSSSGSSKDFWKYDPTTNSWTQKASLTGVIRNSAGAFAISGKGYIGTGYSSFYLGDFWEFTPEDFGVENNVEQNTNFIWQSTSSLLTITSSEISSLSVFDITGKNIFNKYYNNLPEVSCELSNLASGLYIVRVVAENTPVTRKIVKQ